MLIQCHEVSCSSHYVGILYDKKSWKTGTANTHCFSRKFTKMEQCCIAIAQWKTICAIMKSALEFNQFCNQVATDITKQFLISHWPKQQRILRPVTLF